MRITRTELTAIIGESIRNRLRQLYEAAPGDEAPDDRDKEDDEEDGEQDIEPAGDVGGPAVGGPEAQPGKADLSTAEPSGPSPEDQAKDERDALDLDGDASDDPTGNVNDAISGKTVQSIAIENKAKELAGAKAVVISFNETTDTMKVLVTSTGKIAFLWRNKIHDMP